MNLIVLRDDNDARRVFIEPMYDAWPQPAGDIAELVEVELQCSSERPAVAAFAGVNDHPRGFIDDNQAVVFVKNVERNVFRRQCLVRQRGQTDAERIIDAQATARFDRQTVQ